MTPRSSSFFSLDEEAESGAGIDSGAFGYPGPGWWVPDADPSLNFGIAAQSPAIDDSSAPADGATSVAQTAAETQNANAAGIDWWLTPDYDDDPGWVPGVVWQPLTEHLSSLVDEIAATNPVLQEVVERASSLFDELSARYPGIVWPPLFGDSTTPADETAGPDPSTTATDGGTDGQSATSSMTYAEVSAQYPGIVWPVDWYLL